MNRSLSAIRGRNVLRQRGAALVVSLILLAVVTVLGLAGMRSSNLEMKMVASARDREIAFQAAESALAIIEAELLNSPPSVEKLYSSTGTDNGAGNDTGAGRFTAQCNGGLCFDGLYQPGMSEKLNCVTGSERMAGGRKEFWNDPTIWNEGTRHQKQTVKTVASADQSPQTLDVKYIIEFLCYVRADRRYPFDENNPTNGAPLYRITARADGLSGRASVMLQSTFKLAAR